MLFLQVLIFQKNIDVFHLIQFSLLDSQNNLEAMNHETKRIMGAMAEYEETNQV